MSFKNLFNNLFSYTPKENYQFSLSEHAQNIAPNTENNTSNQKSNIFQSLNVNIEYMKTKYNLLINSDIILREFTLNARGKQYNACIFYIDGMVNSQIMDDFVLQPLMLRNKNNLYNNTQNKVVSEAVSNNITVKKVKKFDLSNYLMECLLPQNSVKQVKDFEEVSNSINSRELCIIYRYFRKSF